MRTAIVMIAHGSRRAEANAELVALAKQVAERSPAECVTSAFLELAEPTIPAAARSCVDQGAERVLMFPYFLSSGMHVTRDLEDHRRRLAAEFPGVRFDLARPLGAHAGIVTLVLDLLAECPAGACGAIDRENSLSGNSQSA